MCKFATKQTNFQKLLYFNHSFVTNFKLNNSSLVHLYHNKLCLQQKGVAANKKDVMEFLKKSFTKIQYVALITVENYKAWMFGFGIVKNIVY